MHPRRRRPLHRTHDPRRRSRRSSTTAARRASSSPCSPTAATASCRSAPTTSARTCPTSRDERIQVQLVEVDEVDRVLLIADAEEETLMADIRVMRDDLLPPKPPPRRHLISIADLDAGRRLAPARHRAQLRALARARGEEAADAARPHRRQPLLRVVDAHVVELRARGEAALGRHDVDQELAARRSTRASR